MAQAYTVQIRLTGDSESVQALRRFLTSLHIEGLEFRIDPPRPARKTDSFDMLTHGTITLHQAQHASSDTSSKTNGVELQ